MDERLRKLERLAASGDETASYELKQYRKRSKLVPSDSDLEQMRCGYAEGFGEAIPVVIDIWKTVLEKVFNRASAPYDISVYDDEVGVLHPPEDQIEWDEQVLERINDLAWEEDLDKLRDDLYYITYRLDPYLEGFLDGPGIYLHRNDITGSLRISYIEYREGQEPFKLDTTFRDLRRHPQAKYRVEISWANPRDRNLRYTILPSILQNSPVWMEWGGGTCDYRVFGIGDIYGPIRSWDRL